MRKPALFLLSFWFFVSCPQAQYMGLSKTGINHLSSLINTNTTVKKYYLSFQSTADAALTQEPDPVDTIISEGHLVTNPRKIRTSKALGDMHKIYSLALTHVITHKPGYLHQCQQYLLAWAIVNNSAGHPINDTKLDPLPEAYDRIKEVTPPEQRKIIDSWLSQTAEAEIHNPRFCPGKKSAYNNRNSHRIKVVGLVAYLPDNTKYRYFTDTSLQTQVLKNLYAGGPGMDFEERDALCYHIYTQEPLLRVAKLIQRGGDDYHYRSPTGSSIQHPMDFLVPFVTGEKTHAEFVHSTVPFDGKRADNHEAGYPIGANFEPRTAISVLSQATFFEPSFLKMVQELQHTTDPYPNWEVLVNMLA